MKKIFLITLIGLYLSCLGHAQALKLTSPNGGENWQLGSVHPVAWTATGISQKVKLVLFKDGAKVGLIADNLRADAPFSWTVGQNENGSAAAGGGYAIRVRTMDNAVDDFSNAAFTINAMKVISKLPLERVPPLLLKFPRLAVSDIDLTPNTDGFGIVFSYKNVGNGTLPKASEVPVKPSYRVLIDGKEMAKGFLFIPAFQAQPGWEQTGYFGGWIVFPTIAKAQDTRWYIGNSITVHINENKVMGMESHSLTLQLKPIALKYKYDLLCTALSFNWDTRVLTVLLRLDGEIPSDQKILVFCGGTRFSQDYFHVLLDVNQHNYSLSKKLAILGTSPITLSVGTFVCDARKNPEVGDMDFRNNEWINCKFVYPNSNPVM